MSNPLTGVRAAVKDALTGAGLHAFTHLPERVTPPFAFVGPRDPYVTHNDAPFGAEFVNNQVILVSGKGTNEAAAEELDQMVVTALEALGEQAGDVGFPGRINISGSGEFLAVAIDVTHEIRL